MTTCRFCASDDIVLVASYPDYPVFIGCSDKPRSADDLYNFSIFLCRDCGGMQQAYLPLLDILYGERRFFGGGRMWQKHYDTYRDFITEGLPPGAHVLEVGGGTGTMLSRLAASKQGFELFDVEPHPEYDLPEVHTFRAYFDLDFHTEERFDAVYSSHLVEHLSDVHTFFTRARTILKDGGSLFSACPNIEESFRNLHLNAFTTDHFNYFAPNVLESIAGDHGFSMQRYQMFQDHGMYFQFTVSCASEVPKARPGREIATSLWDKFTTYKMTIDGFAELVAEQAAAPVYLFGAHAFTITFLRHMPADIQYRAVLDNEPTKQDRRLCGTDLMCRSPEVLRNEETPTVVIYMGAYTDEIVDQIMGINPGTRLFRLDRFADA